MLPCLASLPKRPFFLKFTMFEDLRSVCDSLCDLCKCGLVFSVLDVWHRDSSIDVSRSLLFFVVIVGSQPPHCKYALSCLMASMLRQCSGKGLSLLKFHERWPEGSRKIFRFLKFATKGRLNNCGTSCPNSGKAYHKVYRIRPFFI